MNAVAQLMQQGGPVMVPLVVLSVLLYERCFRVLLSLLRTQQRVAGGGDPRTQHLAGLRAFHAGLQESFAHDRVVIAAMIAAAPLLGLLGTVMGMIDTFDLMAGRGGVNSTAGFTTGMSRALLTTATGLSIAIPAVVTMYYAQRQLQRLVRLLVQLEDRTPEAA